MQAAILLEFLLTHDLIFDTEKLLNKLANL